MEPTLLREVEAALEEEQSKKSKIGDPETFLILAACEGDGALHELLIAESSEQSSLAHRKPTSIHPKAKEEERGGALLSSIQVEGFRGIGAPLRLELDPGPGLTLVLGRNGCGKSSLAEGLETLFRGENSRVIGKSKVWQDAWRNLHSQRTSLSAKLMLAEHGEVQLTRSWRPEADFHEGKISLKSAEKELDLASLGLDSSQHSPFLSYAELGKLALQPSTIYDALAGALGLEELVAARTRLDAQLKELERERKDEKGQREALVRDLERSEDPRAQGCLQAMIGEGTPSKPKLDLERLLELTMGEEPAPQLAPLREVAGARFEAPGVSASAQPRQTETDQTTESWAAFAGRWQAAITEVERTQRASSADHAALSQVLDVALNYLKAQPQADHCPVCMQPLPEATLVEIEARHARAKELASEYRAAQRSLQAIEREVEQLQRRLPRAAAAWARTELGDESLSAAIELLREMQPSQLQELGPIVEKHTREVAARAGARLRESHAAFAPLKTRVIQWIELQRKVRASDAPRLQLKRAAEWMKEFEKTLREERFRPFETEVKSLWAELGQGSDVALTEVVLQGSGKGRKVQLGSQVGDKKVAAQGVMSQGELCALSLALFLPRTALPESPFRFVVIDDPVQAMDPIRVGALAKILARTAERVQVVVFTHDERLASAVRRLELPATIWRVVRSANSSVSLEQSTSPSQSYLDDARSLSREDGIGPTLKKRSVPVLYRSALEAAAQTTIRRRRLARGETLQAVEEEIQESRGLHEFIALAIFDHAKHGGHVMREINKRVAREAGDCVMQCKEGAHSDKADLALLHKWTPQIVRWIEGLKNPLPAEGRG